MFYFILFFVSPFYLQEVGNFGVMDLFLPPSLRAAPHRWHIFSRRSGGLSQLREDFKVQHSAQQSKPGGKAQLLFSFIK